MDHRYDTSCSKHLELLFIEENWEPIIDHIGNSYTTLGVFKRVLVKVFGHRLNLTIPAF